MSIQIKSAVAVALLGLAAAAQAVTPTITTTNPTGGVTGASFAADGITPANGTDWQASSGWWTGFTDSITFTFDKPYNLSSAVVTADWNDVYRFSVSTDGWSYTQLFVVSGLFSQPAGSNVTFGQVTMPVTFAPTALAYRFVKVEAVYGDGLNSVGEVSFTGTTAPVPEPSTMAMLLGGVGLVGFLARRRRVF